MSVNVYDAQTDTLTKIADVGGGSSNVVMSLNDFDTGQIWIDGKKIYGKVFTVTNPVLDDSVVVVNNASALISGKMLNYRVDRYNEHTWVGFSAKYDFSFAKYDFNNEIHYALRKNSLGWPVGDVTAVTGVVYFTK